MACPHKSAFTAKAPSTFHGAAYWVRRAESLLWPLRRCRCCASKARSLVLQEVPREGLAYPTKAPPAQASSDLFTWGSPAQTYFSSSEPVHLQHFPPQQAVSKKTCSRNFSYPFDRGEARFICKKGPARPARALVVTKGLKADPHSRVCPAAHHRVALESATLGSFVTHPTKLQTQGKGTSFSQDRDWGTHTNVALQEGVDGVWLV